MRHLKIILLLATFTAGCGNLNGVRMLAPESFGLTPVGSGLYVETGADDVTLGKIREAMTSAEKAIHSAYGSVNSRPIVNVCISRECYKALGGSQGTLGGSFVFLNRLLLAPEGVNWHFIAHEWSHAELYSRLSLRAWWRNPVWFDEGIAVAASEAPEHSDSHWQFLASKNIPRPAREELLSLKSLKQWHSAIHRYGEDRNIERKAKGEPLVNPVYTAAGQEIRHWLAKVGSSGLIALIVRLNDGEDFEAVYQTANPAVERDAPQAARSSP
jgi:hypothetical protein